MSGPGPVACSQHCLYGSGEKALGLRNLAYNTLYYDIDLTTRGLRHGHVSVPGPALFVGMHICDSTRTGRGLWKTGALGGGCHPLPAQIIPNLHGVRPSSENGCNPGIIDAIVERSSEVRRGPYTHQGSDSESGQTGRME